MIIQPYSCMTFSHKPTSVEIHCHYTDGSWNLLLSAALQFTIEKFSNCLLNLHDLLSYTERDKDLQSSSGDFPSTLNYSMCQILRTLHFIDILRQSRFSIFYIAESDWQAICITTICKEQDVTYSSGLIQLTREQFFRTESMKILALSIIN